MKQFDIEKFKRKNIYKVPEDLFENLQKKVMHDVKARKKTPIFKLNWAYAMAASLALIFGITFILNNKDSKNTKESNYYAVNKQEPKKESEIAYETLQSDLTSVENDNQTIEKQRSKNNFYAIDNKTSKTKNEIKTNTLKPLSKKAETQMNEFLDAFSNSEISELASNSTQDVYLDVYN